jgi:hypothetical protein
MPPYPRPATIDAAAHVSNAFRGIFSRQRAQAAKAVTHIGSDRAAKRAEDEDEDRGGAPPFLPIVPFPGLPSPAPETVEPKPDEAPVAENWPTAEALVEAVEQELGLALDSAETQAVTDALMAVVADAGAATIEGAKSVPTVQIGLGVTGDDIFEQINLAARDWARENAAALVSQITQTTRDQIREAIVEGYDDGLSRGEIAASIQDLTAFSDARADLIAATEIRNANEGGALVALQEMQALGISVKKFWMLGPLPCPVCIANAGQGEIDLEAEFLSGDLAPTAHPNCRCALGATVGETSKGAFACE